MEEFSLLQEFKGRSFLCTNESIVLSRASGEVTVRTNDDKFFSTPARQIVLNEQKNESYETTSQQILECAVFNSQRNEADLSLKTNTL